MNQKVTDSYRRRNRKDILFMLRESTEELRRETEVKEEGRKGKVAESSSYLS
jgi:hypothetical protein